MRPVLKKSGIDYLHQHVPKERRVHSQRVLTTKLTPPDDDNLKVETCRG